MVVIAGPSEGRVCLRMMARMIVWRCAWRAIVWTIVRQDELGGAGGAGLPHGHREAEARAEDDVQGHRALLHRVCVRGQGQADPPERHRERGSRGVRARPRRVLHDGEAHGGRDESDGVHRGGGALRGHLHAQRHIPEARAGARAQGKPQTRP
eukprot:7033388-Pyramimonas_sp.AAC.1